MIFDDFKNINIYNINEKIKNFILNIDPKIPLGRHEICEGAYINIDEYQTRSEIKFEAHKKHVDIQFLIEGEEKVFVTETNELVECTSYNEEKDVIFYNTPDRNLNTLFLTKGKFIILYPDDAHSPCTLIDVPKRVKKAIVKIAT